MNPEGVPMHGSGFGGYSAQPGGPKGIQSTTVNIVTDPPKDHIIWSLFMLVYCNPCCLGLASLINSIKSRDRRMVGDVEGARRYGLTARNFNIAASVLAAILVLLYVVYIVMTISKASSPRRG